MGINSNMMNQSVDSFGCAPGFSNEAIYIGTQHGKCMINGK